jgi:FkbM family methyltransferase
MQVPVRVYPHHDNLPCSSHVKTARGFASRTLRFVLPDAGYRVVDSLFYAVSLARGPRSFYRYLRLLLEPRTPVEVSLRGLDHPVFLRPATTDADVAFGTLGRGYHLPHVTIPDDAVIIDLGANIGLTAADYASRYPRATVFAVEMDHDNAAMAVTNTATYGDRVTVINAAAWWEVTTLSYAAEAGEQWGFSISERGDHEVATVAVADLVERHGPIDFLKMDIEGAESEVLTKNTMWAPSVRTIQVETHQPYTVEQCEHDLGALGFVTKRHRAHPDSVNGTRPPAVIPS